MLLAIRVGFFIISGTLCMCTLYHFYEHLKINDSCHQPSSSKCSNSNYQICMCIQGSEINFTWILSNFCKKKILELTKVFPYFMKVLFDNTAISQVKNHAHKRQFFMFYILKFHAPIWLSSHTVKFRKLAPGLIFFKGPFWGAYFWRGLSTEGNLCLKIDWASLIAGSKFTFFALFYFVFEGNFPITSPWGGLYL